MKLVKEEQKIYNIIFSEVIRQVSVECIERGTVLAELRKRYAKMLDKVPRQVKRYVWALIISFIISLLNVFLFCLMVLFNYSFGLWHFLSLTILILCFLLIVCMKKYWRKELWIVDLQKNLLDSKHQSPYWPSNDYSKSYRLKYKRICNYKSSLIDYSIVKIKTKRTLR